MNVICTLFIVTFMHNIFCFFVTEYVSHHAHLSAFPEVRGTADTDGGAYSPSGKSSSYSLTTLSSSRSTDRRAVTGMNGKTRTLRCAPFYAV